MTPDTRGPLCFVFLTPSPNQRARQVSFFLLKSLLRLESKVSTKCQALHRHTCGGGLLARCERPPQCATEGTCGKMFKPDSNAGGPEQAEQKRTLQGEVIVLVGLRWQNTNTFRSVVHQRRYILLQNPRRFKDRVKREQVWSVELLPLTYNSHLRSCSGRSDLVHPV